ncbi:MAG: hypothetical protein V4732_04435 [Pseudomonadota bacterium]
MKYAPYLLVFGISVGCIYFMPDSEFIQKFGGIPVVGSLVGALFKILTDQIAYERTVLLNQMAHERSLLLKNIEQRFSLATSSHMANAAFDKHTKFGDEYAKELREVVKTLFKEGPTDKALTHAHNLYLIRNNYEIWLTEKIIIELETFESTLRKLGAAAHYVNATNNEPERSKAHDTMYKLFADLLGKKLMGEDLWLGEKLDDEKALSLVTNKLRTILGIEELTSLRLAIVSTAILENNEPS